MRTLEKRKNVKNGIARFVLVVLAFIFEVAMAYGILMHLNDQAEWISIVTRLVGFLIILSIYSSDKTSAIKMPWIMLIAVAPLAGVFLYIMIETNPNLRSKRKKYQALHELYAFQLYTDDEIKNQLKRTNPYSYNISEYILKHSGFPLYNIKELTYYPSANEALEAQKNAFRNAKHYIFMEYHAIENAETWLSIQSILEEKVREGVEVRILYDDMGSIEFVNTDFAKQLEKKGLKCKVFNAFAPGLKLFLNNRDHRKMSIVDGQVAFTGGYNLANEYVNIVKPYGFWKDTGIKLTGKSVTSFTAMFLVMWSLVDKSKEVNAEFSYFCNEDSSHDNKKTAPGTDTVSIFNHFYDQTFLNNESSQTLDASTGFIQPYGESPMVKEKLAENVYINMVDAAKDYVWFVTPYLILTDEMISSLTNAAKRGVDVRIITPGIPDKKVIYSVTRSFYHILCKCGVKIYEYSPGFCHCKMCVSDDERAICGTINLDYRSLYYHFEDGCFFTNCDAVIDMKKDFEQMYAESNNVTDYYAEGLGTFHSIRQLLLRFVAQLL